MFRLAGFRRNRNKSMKKFLITIGIVVILLVAAGAVLFSLRSRSLADEDWSARAQAAAQLCQPTTQPEIARPFGLSMVSAYEPASWPYLEELGIKDVRTDLHWHLIEPKPNQYHWNDVDALLRGFGQRQINLYGVINIIPNWAKSWDQVFNQLKTFTTAMAERYKPEGVFPQQERCDHCAIQYWEVFNESNFPGHGWLGRGVKAEVFVDEYVMALATVNQALHALDPQAVIILTGLSNTGLSATEFLERVYQLGAKNCFDIIAYHPYGQIDQLSAVKLQFEAVVKKYNDQKPIWFNEFGENRDQDKIYSFKKVLGQRAELAGFFWYNLRDYYQPTDDGFGLLNHDFSPKPVYAEFKKLLAK